MDEWTKLAGEILSKSNGDATTHDLITDCQDFVGLVLSELSIPLVDAKKHER